MIWYKTHSLFVTTLVSQSESSTYPPPKKKSRHFQALFENTHVVTDHYSGGSKGCSAAVNASGKLTAGLWPSPVVRTSLRAQVPSFSGKRTLLSWMQTSTTYLQYTDFLPEPLWPRGYFQNDLVFQDGKALVIARTQWRLSWKNKEVQLMERSLLVLQIWNQEVKFKQVA